LVLRQNKPSADKRIFASVPVALLVVAVITTSAIAAPPNDPYYEMQTGLQAIGAEFAWGKTQGEGTTIAIIDTGVDLEHPDLKGKLVPGKDWLDSANRADDRHGHGTLVAGLAAAATNNGEGVAGVAPSAEILPLRVFNEDGHAQPEHAVQAINYAVERVSAQGKRLILNLSFDWSGPDGENLEGLLNDPSVTTAVKDAAKSGAAVIVAAGNSGEGQTAFDATEPGIIVVGYSNKTYTGRHPESSYGAGLDILAPGDFEVSTYWDPADGQSKYAKGKGSSMAVPFVSGTVALLMADGLSNTQAVDRVMQTAKDLGSPGRDDQTGHGFLDTARALGVSRTAPTPATPRSPNEGQPPPSPALELPSPDPAPSLVEPVSEPDPATDPLAIAESDDNFWRLPIVIAQALLILGLGILQLDIGYRRWRYRRG
jgi:subtilisin family serine protease